MSLKKSQSDFMEANLKHQSFRRQKPKSIEQYMVFFLGNSYPPFPIFSSMWRNSHDQTHVTSLYTHSSI